MGQGLVSVEINWWFVSVEDFRSNKKLFVRYCAKIIAAATKFYSRFFYKSVINKPNRIDNNWNKTYEKKQYNFKDLNIVDFFYKYAHEP